MFSLKSYSQTFSIIKNEYFDANNANSRGWALSIKVEHDTAKAEFYSASCYFGEMPLMTDSVRLLLIESLLSELSDTSACGRPLQPLSYRYRGRHNKNPLSNKYNLQIEALILINYIALSSEAVAYSPFPVLYDKIRKKEITTTGSELNAVIKSYRKWFEALRKNRMDHYYLPMISKRFEWYGSLFQSQRFYNETPKWEEFYSCQVLIKEED